MVSYKIQNHNVMLATDYINLVRGSKWETYQTSTTTRDEWELPGDLIDINNDGNSRGSDKNLQDKFSLH